MEEEDGERCSQKFANLPDIVLLKIFAYLDIIDLCSARRACSRWHNITKCPSLWRTVDTRRIALFSEEIEKLLQMLPSCVQNLRFRAFPGDDFLPFVDILKQKCPDLESLIMEDVVLTTTGTRFITVEDFPFTLLVLSMRNAFFLPDKFFSKFTPIRVLDLNMCRGFTNDHVQLLSKYQFLQEIYLTGCSITDIGLQELVKALPAITVLDVEKTNVKGFALLPLSRNCLALEKLFLGLTRVTDLQLRTIPMGSFPNLWTICLNGTVTSWRCHRDLLVLLPALQVLNGSPRSEVMRRMSDSVFKSCEHFLRREKEIRC